MTALPVPTSLTQTVHQNLGHLVPHLLPTSGALSFPQNRGPFPPQLPPASDTSTVHQNRGHLPPQLLPTSDTLTVHQNHGRLPPQLPLAGDRLVAGASSMAGSAEYDAAMELELWKLTEEENFQEQLKEREKTHMTKLG